MSVLMNSEKYIEKCKKVYPDAEWDYDKVEYKGSHENVCIGCKKHGYFFISATNFLCGRGCKLCNKEMGKKKKTDEDVINSFNKIWKGEYDYSKFHFVNAKTKSCVVCKKHGEFWTTPERHLRGCGCKKCAIEKHSREAEFYDNAIKKYGEGYDYSESIYTGFYKGIDILCKKHGKFRTTPYRHLNGKGCPICEKEKKLEEKKHLKETLKEEKRKEREREIINKCIIIHKNKYSYEKCHFVNYNTKFIVTCPEHGDFLVLPGNHLNGKGCPKCVGKGRTDVDVINDFKKIHGEEYIYDKMHYINAKTKVCIICRKHGEFWLTPNKHLGGRGCPICNESLLEKNTRDYFNKNGIKFIARATKKDFSWIGLQHLDFYLPDYNVAIECQGPQHLQKGKYYFGYEDVEKQFIKQLKLDIEKFKKCDYNGLKLFYLLPKSFENKNIEKEPIFEGIYNEKNTFYSINKFKEKILNEINIKNDSA